MTSDTRVVAPAAAALTELVAAVATPGCRILSTDVFDTVLLRDYTTESARMAIAARRAADRLGIDARALVRLRWAQHDNAFRAVAMERPQGDATLTAIARAVATACGLGEAAARVLRDTEVEVDVEHLRPHRGLINVLAEAARRGLGVIALSDTYYSAADVSRLLTAVTGEHPIARVYCSADLGLTKHAGRAFAEVAHREDVAPAEIVHVGDNWHADVRMAEAAGWKAVHLPRPTSYAVRKLGGRLVSGAALTRRAR
jgi:FMN phosphatase YigB (HAD superfamily)